MKNCFPDTDVGSIIHLTYAHCRNAELLMSHKVVGVSANNTGSC